MTRYVRPRLGFIPPTFNPLSVRLAHLALPLLLRLRLRPWLPSGITEIQTTQVEALVDLYRRFEAGEIRFLMAFRHVEVDDPLCALYLLSRAVPRVARQQGVSLKRPIHSHFMYDRGMPIWGGRWLGWFLSKAGGVPVRRGKSSDRSSLRAARQLLIEGQFPLAVAPEGATNGHSERLSPLEPGTAQLGFWGMEDLAKAGRSQTVWIVPIGIQYRYVTPPWRKLDRLLSQLEADCGLPVQTLGSQAGPGQEKVYAQRLYQLGDRLLSTLEDFYRRFYHQPVPDWKTQLQSEEALKAQFDERLQTLLNIALRVAEEYFGISSQGSVIERCRRLEEAGWTYIYRDDIPDQAALNQLSFLERGLADWVAEEALLRMQHMRIVESFVAVSRQYVQEKPSIERCAEMALLMFDLLARLRGDKLPGRPRLGARSARITVGEPISLAEYWPTYKSSHRAAREVVAQLTQTLQTALEATIKN